MEDGMGCEKRKNASTLDYGKGESTSVRLCPCFHFILKAPQHGVACPICFWLNGRWFGGPREPNYSTHHYQIYKQNYYKPDIQRPRHNSQLIHNLQALEKSPCSKIFTPVVWDIVSSSMDLAFLSWRYLHFCLVKNILLSGKGHTWDS